MVFFSLGGAKRPPLNLSIVNIVCLLILCYKTILQSIAEIYCIAHLKLFIIIAGTLLQIIH